MSRIRSKNTTPEIRVRSQLHKMGYRFRLNADDMPGKPDIVLKKHKTVIQVNGCFWHRHRGCKFAYTPSTHSTFWKEKFERNVRREIKNKRMLKKSGWRVVVIWECETGNEHSLERILRKTLRQSRD